MWWWLLTLALADGRVGGGDLTLTGPTTGAPDEIVELTLTGGRGEAHLLHAPALGAPIRSPQAIGAAVLHLAQPMGHVTRQLHRGETVFRVHLPLTGQAAWQIILAHGASRASSNPWVITAQPARAPSASTQAPQTSAASASPASTAHPAPSDGATPAPAPSTPHSAPQGTSSTASPARAADTADTAR